MIRIVVGEAPVIEEFAIAPMISGTANFTLGGTFEVAEELLLHIADHDADLVVLDLNTLRGDGRGAIRRLKSGDRCSRVLALCSNVSRAVIRDAIDAGADGYVVHIDRREQLADIMRAVAAGNGYFDDEIAEAFRDPGLETHDLEVRDPDRWEIDAISMAPPSSGESSVLTQRELEILSLVAVGYSSQAIADRLCISVPTVRKHRENLMRKLGLHNTAGVTAYAIAHGLISSR